MANPKSFELGTVFRAVGEELEANQQDLNQLDVINGNHGDHQRKDQVLKAVMAGMAAWNLAESGKNPKENPLDIGNLFDYGVAYLQARQRCETRIDTLADTAATISPLSRVNHR